MSPDLLSSQVEITENHSIKRPETSRNNIQSHIQSLTRKAVHLAGMLAVTSAVFGCSDPKQYFPDEVPKPFNPLSVFSNDPTFYEIVLDGCKAWEPKGVSCKITEDIMDADVTVTSIPGDCVVDELSGKNFFASTDYDDATISYFPDCVEKGGGKPENIFAHEFGHICGIEWHIPKNNTLDPKFEEKIVPGTFAGPALMNAVDYTPYMTKFDHFAFEQRNDSRSRLKPLLDECLVDHIDLSQSANKSTLPITINGKSQWFSSDFKPGDELIKNVNTSSTNASGPKDLKPGTLVVWPVKFGEEASIDGLPSDVTCRRIWTAHNELAKSSCEVYDGILKDCVLPAGTKAIQALVVNFSLE